MPRWRRYANNRSISIPIFWSTTWDRTSPTELAKGKPDRENFAPLRCGAWDFDKFRMQAPDKDLLKAIQAHQSGSFLTRDASEANAVIAKFNSLTESQKQNILNFLRSL